MHKTKRATIVVRPDTLNTIARNIQNQERIHGEADREEAVATIIKISYIEVLEEVMDAAVVAAIIGNVDEPNITIPVAVINRTMEILF